MLEVRRRGEDGGERPDREGIKRQIDGLPADLALQQAGWRRWWRWLMSLSFGQPDVPAERMGSPDSTSPASSLADKVA